MNVLVKQRGREDQVCETVSELATVLGLQPMLVSPDPAGNCLCNLRADDLGAVETTNREDGFPWVGWVIRKK
jgi:hypothetical protein